MLKKSRNDWSWIGLPTGCRKIELLRAWRFWCKKQKYGVFGVKKLKKKLFIVMKIVIFFCIMVKRGKDSWFIAWKCVMRCVWFIVFYFVFFLLQPSKYRFFDSYKNVNLLYPMICFSYKNSVLFTQMNCLFFVSTENIARQKFSIFGKKIPLRFLV